MEHDFTPDAVAPWPDKNEKPVADTAPALDGAETTEAPAPAGIRRDAILGALIVILTGAGTLALLVARGGAPATAAAATTVPVPAVTPTPDSAPDFSWTAKAPRWVANPDAWLGRAKGVAFEVSAAEPVGVWMRTVRPALVVRCSGGRAEVFVFTDSAAMIEAKTEDHTVTFAFDTETPTTTRWPDGAEHNALFAPDGPGLTARLMHADSFTFGYTPHNAGAISARFNTSGLADLLKPAAKHCGW
jgi:hypothetical protein